MDKEGEYQYFPSKVFCVTVPKSLVDKPYSVSLIPGVEKFYASYGYVKIFRRTFFVSQNRKTLQVNASVLCFRKFLVAKKFLIRGEWDIMILRRKIFVSQCRKIS